MRVQEKMCDEVIKKKIDNNNNLKVKANKEKRKMQTILEIESVVLFLDLT